MPFQGLQLDHPCFLNDMILRREELRKNLVLQDREKLRP